VVTGTDLSWWQGPTYRGDRDRLIVVTVTDLSWWQGPTYRGDRDWLIVVTGTDLSWWQWPTYRGDSDRLIVVTGTDLSWWQGPTYRGDRDRLIVVTVTDLSWWQGQTYRGPYKTTGKIIVLYILIFIFLHSKLKDKIFAPNDRKHSLSSMCSLLLPEWNFDLSRLFPNILSVPPFQRIYEQSVLNNLKNGDLPKSCFYTLCLCKVQ
jgi:hypothetical protein